MFKFALNILANVAGRSNEYFRTHTFTDFPKKTTQYSTRAEMFMDSIRVYKAKYKKMQRYNAQKDRNCNKKLRSFKSKEYIHKKEVGPYRGFGY